MVRTALCLDQAGVIYPICDNPPVQPCCLLSQYINNSIPQWYVPCNQQVCPSKCIIIHFTCIYYIQGGPDSVLGFVPHTKKLSHEGGSSVVIVTLVHIRYTQIIMISVLTNVTAPAPGTLSFLTIMTIHRYSNRVFWNYDVSQSYPTPTFSSASGQITINSRSLFPATTYSTVRTIAPTGLLGFIKKAAVYQQGTNAGIASYFGISSYYYVSPLGHLYEYPNTKPVQDKAPGKFFLKRILGGGNIIITSEHPFITASLSRFSGSAFTIVPVTNGAAIAFNFQNTGTTNFIVSSCTILNKTVAPTTYVGRVLTVGGRTYQNIEVVQLVGEGFENYAIEMTAFSTYDAYYLNGRRAVFSTSARLSSMIQEGQMFLAGGGTPAAAFSVVGNRVVYSGVTVFNITPSINSINVNVPGVVDYDGQVLTSGGSVLASGFGFFSFNVANINGSAFNGGATVSLPPQIVATLYTSGADALLTDSDSLKAAIAAAQQPTTIPRNTASYVTILRQGTGILQLNRNDVVSITGSVRTLNLRKGNRIHYSVGTIIIIPCNSHGPFNGITKFTYAPSGQNIQRYINTTDQTFNVDLSYQFLVDSSGNALLTNDAQVKGLVANPQFSVMFGPKNPQGQFSFILGGSNIQKFNRTTLRHVVQAHGRIRLVNNVLSGTDMNANNLFQNAMDSITTFFSTERVPGTLSGLLSITVSSSNYVYITGRSAFITDRSTLDIAIISAIIEPLFSSNSFPTTMLMPTIVSTTAPSTLPATIALLSIVPPSCSCPSIVPVCKPSVVTTSTIIPTASKSTSVPIISSTVTVDRKIIEGQEKFQVVLNIEIK